jgi:tripeptide aminopeptidase
MKPYLDKAPKVVQLVRLAYEKAGLTPIEEPIRGGTDGARLSSLGLPCPNVFTGRLTINNCKACRSLSNFSTSISTSIHRKLIESIQMSRAPSSA